MKIHILWFSFCFTSVLFSQNEYLVDSLVKELGITEIISTIHKTDTSYVFEIRKFNKDGREIEKISPSYDGIIRRSNRYDSLDRRTNFILYNKKDTTEIEFERTWTYLDSNYYYEKEYNSKRELQQTNECKVIEEDNALWIYETEIDHARDDRSTKKISKYTRYGDSLQITEFANFDRQGKMKDITSYYDIIRVDSSAKRRIQTAGTCFPIVPELDPLTQTVEAYKEYFTNLEKYLAKQLNGDYLYELNDDTHTYRVYNFQNQLIQDGFGIFDMKTFEYNSEGQLITVTHWGVPIDDHGIVKTGESVYSYYRNGLPKSIKVYTIDKKLAERSTFEYQ